MSWTSPSFGVLQKRELHAEPLSLREVLRQRYLELAKQRLRLDGVVTEPTEPSNCLNLDGNPLFRSDNLALGPLQIGK
jgi:hypothetical protein